MSTDPGAVRLVAEVLGALGALAARTPAARHVTAMEYLNGVTHLVEDMNDAAEVLDAVDEIDPLANIDLHEELRGRVLYCQASQRRTHPRFTRAGRAGDKSS